MFEIFLLERHRYYVVHKNVQQSSTAQKIKRRLLRNDVRQIERKILRIAKS